MLRFDPPERNLPQQTRSKALLQPACQNNQSVWNSVPEVSGAQQQEEVQFSCMVFLERARPQSLPVLLLSFSLHFSSVLTTVQLFKNMIRFPSPSVNIQPLVFFYSSNILKSEWLTWKNQPSEKHREIFLLWQDSKSNSLCIFIISPI